MASTGLHADTNVSSADTKVSSADTNVSSADTNVSSADTRILPLYGIFWYYPPIYVCGQWWLSWYSDLLRAGRSADRIPFGGEIFHARPDRPWGPPSLLYKEYRVSFPGVKRPRRGVDHPLPSSADFKERVQLYLYSPSGSSCSVLGRTLSFTVYIWVFQMISFPQVLPSKL